MSTPIFLPCPDADALRAAIAPWLAVGVSPYALICGVAARDGAWCGVVCLDGAPIVALAQTSPWPVVIASPLPVDAAVAGYVADILGQPGRTVRGINGPAAWSEAVVAALPVVVTHRMQLRLHGLLGQPQQPTCPPGQARFFSAGEDRLLVEWIHAFSDEVGDPRQTIDASAIPSLRQHALAWTVDDQPVAMARRLRPLFGGWSIAGVYTPPHLRCRGYAGAVVHALSARLLEEGAAYVVLFTDLANPVSNRLYARIGFAPLLDQTRIAWEMPL